MVLVILTTKVVSEQVRHQTVLQLSITSMALTSLNKPTEQTRFISIYDSSNELIGFNYADNDYFYVKNQQGDITDITNSSSEVVASYAYDPWGRVISITGDETIGNLNPFRYRSYYYDSDIQMYYLQSRYYDPEVCRFVNCDELHYAGSDKVVISYNVFVYCENNPINSVDDFGNSPTQFLNDIKKDYIKHSFPVKALFVSLIVANLKNIYLAFHEFAQVLIAASLHLNNYDSRLEKPCIKKSKKNGVKEIDVWGSLYPPHNSSCFVWEVKPEGTSATKQVNEYIDLCPGYKKGFKLKDISVRIEDDLYFKIRFDGKGGAFYKFTNKSNKRISNKDMVERITYAKNAVIGIGIGILIVVCAGAIAATVSSGTAGVTAVVLKKL